MPIENRHGRKSVAIFYVFLKKKKKQFTKSGKDVMIMGNGSISNIMRILTAYFIEYE